MRAKNKNETIQNHLAKLLPQGGVMHTLYGRQQNISKGAKHLYHH